MKIDSESSKIAVVDETKKWDDSVEIKIIESKDVFEPFACNACKVSFKMRKDAKRHLTMHGDDSYACYLCKIPFNNFNSLRVHINVKECAKICYLFIV